MTIKSCGIDFGTSNSTCAVANSNSVRLVNLEGKNSTIPSAIFYSTGKEVFYGRSAINAYVEGEEGRLMRGLKMVLGTSLIEERTRLGLKSIRFTEVLADFMSYIKSKAEDNVQDEISNVVLGRPVHFHDNDTGKDKQSEEALLKIAKSVGFKTIRFQFEPIAAAFAHEKDLDDEQLSLIIDLGGGTSDFTVIKMSSARGLVADRSGDILATAGIRVGGTHFDERLSMKFFMPLLGLGTEYSDIFDQDKTMTVPIAVYSNLSSWPKVHFAQTPKAIRETQELIRRSYEPEKLEKLLSIQSNQEGHAFLQAVENAKIALTDQNRHMEFFPKIDVQIETSRDGFEEAINSEISKISNTISSCLSEAGVSESDIKLVVLTGGSTELPIINRLVKSRFPDARVSNDDKFGSVGVGLGHYAQAHFK